MELHKKLLCGLFTYSFFILLIDIILGIVYINQISLCVFFIYNLANFGGIIGMCYCVGLWMSKKSIRK